MTRRIESAKFVLAGVAIALALTGCGRFGNGVGADEPPSPVPSVAPPVDTMDDVQRDLDGVDDSLTQVESDAGAGDTAAGTADAP